MLVANWQIVFIQIQEIVVRPILVKVFENAVRYIFLNYLKDIEEHLLTKTQKVYRLGKYSIRTRR
jgi:hypothetical protein